MGKTRGEKSPLREQCNAILFEQSISRQKSFLETSFLDGKDGLVDMYALFGFERLHNFHLGLSRFLQECTFQYVCRNEAPEYQKSKDGQYLELENPFFALSILFWWRWRSSFMLWESTFTFHLEHRLCSSMYCSKARGFAVCLKGKHFEQCT